MTIVEDAQTIRDLVDEHVSTLSGIARLTAEGISMLVGELIEDLRNGAEIDAGTVSTNVSAARKPSAFERSDPLPVGRMRHSPYGRLTHEEKVLHTERVLRGEVGWFSVKEYCEQHYETAAAACYYRGVFLYGIRFLGAEGRIKYRPSTVRGERYQYQLKSELRSVS
jgi:hypothetical protein